MSLATFIQGSAHDLADIPDASVQMIATLFQVFARSVGVAMNPVMAVATERNEVVRIGAQFGMPRPGLQMVSMEMPLGATPGAYVIVSGVDCSEKVLPFGTAVSALAFRRTAINVIRVQRPTLAIHTIAGTSKPRLVDRCLYAQDVLGCLCVCLAQERIDRAWLRRPVIQPRLEVMSPRARWDAVTNKPFVNALRVAMHDFGNVVFAKLFVNVLPTQPCFVYRLLGALPFGLAFQRTESPRLATPTNL